ncbi:MAG: WYL domain-containing protein [Methylacidiphilaceae bacterium]|nr:WYL domain-containing protein [Candidatus Methylacidiphilaceae bacterium]
MQTKAFPFSRPPMRRMIAIHRLLSSKRTANCQRLAKDLEVSSKTIQRDIEFMREQLDLPIEYDSGRRSFFYAREVGQLPFLSMSEGELVALLVAEKAMEQYRETPFARSLAGAFRKITSSLTERVTFSWDWIAEAYSFRAAGVAKADLRVFRLLSKGLLESREVEFDYWKLEAEGATRRRVQPYHVANIEKQWYLFGFDLLREGVRTFALSRIQKLTLLKRRFRRPDGFSVASLLETSFGVFEAESAEEVCLRLDPLAARLVAERQWHPSQEIRKDGDSVELLLRVGVSAELERWILGWGAHVEVLRPAALRLAVREASRRLAGLYVHG